MAYIKNPTEEQKQVWSKQAAQQEKYVKELIVSTAILYQENPENIAELLQFGSKFYRYSVKNNMLVYAQNKGATYVQSFAAWKKMGYAINKGETGIKVYTPVKATVLKVGDKLVPLEQATKEEKVKYQAGEIESITETHFKVGNVFDIAQTNFPKELYPQIFSMGYESAYHSDVVKGLADFATGALGCSVDFTNLGSISLRGDFAPADNRIRINELLEDTEKVSTMSHEIGHALLHKHPGKSLHQKEFEADALSIMLQSHLGIALSDTRKSHLADHYRAYHEELAANNQKEVFTDVLDKVYKSFRLVANEVEKCIEPYISVKQEKQWINMNQSVPAYRRTPSEKQIAFAKNIAQTIGGKEPDMTDGMAVSAFINQNKDRFNEVRNQMVTDRIKREVAITDYATMHGMQVKRQGRYFTLLDHDSVRIDPDRNCFWRNSGIGQNNKGSVIDFAMHFVTDGNKNEALAELSTLIGTDHQFQQIPNAATVKKEKPVLNRPTKPQLPERGQNMKRAFAYLLKSRYIDQDIVQDFVDRKMLYQDVRGNCVFVAYDNEQQPNFACVRGTLSDVKFLGDVEGNDYSKGFYINNQKDKLIVAESVIDAMSVMSILKGQQIDFKDYDYQILTGTEKYESILNHLQEAPKKEVLLALDSDKAGMESMQKIEQLLKDKNIDTQVSFHVPEAKDWNEDLVKVARKFKSMDLIPFLENSDFPKMGSGDGKEAESKAVVSQAVAAQETEQRSEEGSIQIKRFLVEDGLCMAEVVYEGETSREALCRDNQSYYISTGMEYDDTLEQHILSEDDLELYEAFKAELGEQYTEQEIGGMIQISDTEQKTMPDTQTYLKRLQQQELKKNATMLGQTMSMNIEMEL